MNKEGSYRYENVTLKFYTAINRDCNTSDSSQSTVFVMIVVFRVTMAGFGRYQQVYQMSHEFEEVTISVSFLMVNGEVPNADVMDITEDLSHQPYAERREFMQALHEQYQQTRCVGRIHTNLNSNSYYAHIQSLGYSIANVALAMGAGANHFQYFIFM